MTTGEKIATLRKAQNLTQEQLAERLGVSRQSVSKWESDLAYPETEKLIRLSELFDCSVDSLLRPSAKQAQQSGPSGDFLFRLWRFSYSYQSNRRIHGLPLVDIQIGTGRVAKGVFAIGLRAKGIISLGLLSMGFLSVGACSLGVLSFGSLALGLLSAGAIAAGGIAVGAIAVGLFAIGAVSVGLFAAGAAAFGYYGAFGDWAQAKIAIGGQVAHGSLFLHASKLQGDLTEADLHTIRALLADRVPLFWRWLSKLFSGLLS